MSQRPDVYERDIDDLLSRQLSVDARFAEGFIAHIASQIGRPLAYRQLRVSAQVRHERASGTIDLVVHLLDGDGRETARLLIENKVNSGFTANQPERYASSARHLSTGDLSAFPIICAPDGYLTQSKQLAHFAARVSYETLSRWLSPEDRTIAEQAILRFETLYEPVPVAAVGDFHAQYVTLARLRAPILAVKPNPNSKGARPEGSRTIYFVARKSLPSYDFLPTLRFSHQCWDSSAPSPSVKVMFAGWARHTQLLADRSGQHLAGTGLYLRKARESLGLVRDTPRMDNMRPVAEQQAAVEAGIDAALLLRQWMLDNEAILHDWAAAVAKHSKG